MHRSCILSLTYHGGKYKEGIEGEGVVNRKVEIFMYLCYGMLFIYFQKFIWVREVCIE